MGLRQFGKGLGLRLAEQRIHRIEKGCLGSLKATIDLVTIELQYANIHLSKAPAFLFL